MLVTQQAMAISVQQLMFTFSIMHKKRKPYYSNTIQTQTFVEAPWKGVQPHSCGCNFQPFMKH